MSGVMCALAGAAGFKPITNTYTTGTGATETIPVGARFLTIEIWASGGFGGAGTGSGCAAQSGSGAGGGGYCRTASLAVGGSGGKTITYTVGAVPTGGNPGNASTVSNGTFTVTTLTANGGAAGTGPLTAGGVGGTATGGSVNTTGNTGGTAASGGTGAAAIVGVTTSAGAGGFGGQNAAGSGRTAGGVGKVVFIYT